MKSSIRFSIVDYFLLGSTSRGDGDNRMELYCDIVRDGAEREGDVQKIWLEILGH